MRAATAQELGAPGETAFVDVPFGGRAVRIEHAWVGPADDARPPLVFLHEGLGSLSMWKDFPARLCEAVGRRGLVYSRPGYGCSTPRPSGERWGVDFMHRQAEELLPALLAALGVRGPYVLFGHSDGASIALIHAARFPGRVAGAIVLAPHILVEEFGLASIREAREAYARTDLRRRLARYHDDVDSAFRGWNDIWLAPEFVRWTIVPLLPRIACPVLALQGLDDQYGTMAQIEGIAAAVPDTTLVKLRDCGHSPHRDQTEAVIAATSAFLGIRGQALSGRADR
jgi:pimeloyl-ACP methyl ester carboxylesterase